MIKFLGVILDKDLTWRDHINTVETKIAKNIRLLYKARQCLNKECLKQLYFSYIYSYSSYANIAWASEHKAKLKKLVKSTEIDLSHDIS